MKAAAYLSALALLACRHESPVPEQGERAMPASVDAGPHEDESEHERIPRRVRLAAGVVASAGIRTAPAETATLPATVDLTGEVAVDPDRAARLTARIAGRIVDVRVKEGDHVAAGAVVAVLESPELARERAGLRSSEAHEVAAQANFERLSRLEAKSLASGQEVATAKAEAASLASEARSHRETLAALGQDQAGTGNARVTLRAPLAGTVLVRDAVRGQTVDPEHVIVVLGDLGQAHFLARLFEKDLARVRIGAEAEVRLNAYPEEVFRGQVISIGKQIDPAARTVTARILMRDQKDLLKVGLFGTVRVATELPNAAKPTVVVPLAALTQVASQTVVFVLQADGDYELHPVILGRTAAGRAEVLSGLRAGERVVVNGVFTLKSAVLKSTFGEDE